jgi:hypothetical protein
MSLLKMRFLTMGVRMLAGMFAAKHDAAPSTINNHTTKGENP